MSGERTTNPATPFAEWHIHCRAPNEKKSMLLAAKRLRTRLRIHALRYTVNAAKRQLAVLRKDFPECFFKLVKARQGK